MKRYFEQKGCVYYSQKLIDEFAAESLDAYKSNRMTPNRHQRIRKVIAMLAEYKDTGAIKWACLPNSNEKTFTCKHFETILSQFLLEISERYAPKTIKQIGHLTKQFLLYLEENGHRRISCLNRKIVNAYIPLTAKRQPGNMSNVVTFLKCFLRYLLEKDYIASELVSALPGYAKKERNTALGLPARRHRR